MTIRSTAYSELAGLGAYYLEDSYVLGIRLTGSAIDFDLLAVLTPNHPDYSPPSPAEQYCYRLARLSFPGLRRFGFLTQNVVVPSIDADDQRDLGNLDSLVRVAGHYRLEGSWGDLEIESDPPTMTLEPSGDIAER